MLTNSIRNLTGLLLWLLLTVIAVYVNVQVTLANYLGSKAALELQGYEAQPLHTDSLVGRFLGSLFGEATLAQFFALGVAIIEALGLFFLFHIGFEIWRLWTIRREHRHAIQNDSPAPGGLNPAEQIRAANERIVTALIQTACLLFLLYWVISWDLELYRFRSVAGALANGSPEIKPMEVPSWANFVTANNSLFIRGLIDIGAWGYLAITALGCFLLEQCFERLSERWARLVAPIDNLIDRWFAPPQEQETLYGYDINEQPVYDPNAAIAYGVNGYPVNTETTSGDNTPVDDEQTVVRSTRGTSGTQVGEIESTTVVDDRRTPEASADNRHAAPLFDLSSSEAPAATDRAFPPHRDVAPMEDSQLHDVIGSNGERVSLARAQADHKRYYVDRSRRIWNRAHWENLFGESESEAKAA